MRVAVQRDPIEHSVPGETTHLLAREAQARGATLWCYPPTELRYESPTVRARARRLRYLSDRPSDPRFELGDVEDLDLAKMDVVLLRQDPPVDLAWLSTTWMLEHLPPTTRVLNPPGAVRDTSEKLVVLTWPHLAPPTLVTADPARIRAFRAHHGDLVIKPLFGKAGQGVFIFDRDDRNFDVVVDDWVRAQGCPVMVQRYMG